jgi:hypothetical protein
MNPYDKLLHTIFRITVFTLALVIITVVAVMCKAIFDPNVDNKEIFAMLSPAFNTVIGAFVGLLGGISLTRPTKEDMFTAPTEDPKGPIEAILDTVEDVKDAVVEEVVQVIPEEVVEEVVEVVKKTRAKKSV